LLVVVGELRRHIGCTAGYCLLARQELGLAQVKLGGINQAYYLTGLERLAFFYGELLEGAGGLGRHNGFYGFKVSVRIGFRIAVAAGRQHQSKAGETSNPFHSYRVIG
jgi:hypothetical protein